jgi:hypothetical protein
MAGDARLREGNSRSLTRELLYTTPPLLLERISMIHQGLDMGRRDDVYIFPMISKQAHG